MPGFSEELSSAAEKELDEDALQSRLDQFTAGMTCFSCGAAYSRAIHSEPCDQSHREHWSHEWVSQRVVDLTQKLSQASSAVRLLAEKQADAEQENQRLNNLAERLRSEASGFPSRSRN